MVRGVKKFVRKLCVIIVLLIYINSPFVASVNAYTDDLAVNSDKAEAINSVLAGTQKQATIVNSLTGDNSLSASAFSFSSFSNVTSSENLIDNGDFESDPNEYGAWTSFYDDTKATPEFIWDAKLLVEMQLLYC